MRAIHNTIVCALSVVVFLFASVVASSPRVYAEECFITLDSAKRVLEDALKDCEEKIEETAKVLAEQQRKRTDAEYDILLIDHEINQALLRIRTNDIAINNLGEEITSTEEVIEDLGGQLDEQQNVFATILQRSNEVEQRGFLSLLLSDEPLSSFLTASNEYGELREGLEESIVSIEHLQSRLSANVEELEGKKQVRYQTRAQQRADVAQVKTKRVEKQGVLDYRLAVEAQTQEKIDTYESRAGQISNRLFQLRGGGAVPFDEALRYAEEAQRQTNIRPAFLLGLIKHESDLGHNVGTGSYLIDMHPTRDRPIFPFIAKLLDYDVSELRVSANPGFGWGGAMGPAQFIPSTWVCYGGLIHTKTGTCNKTQDLIRTKQVLEIGSSGADVKRLQQFLNKNGFTVATSGAGSPGRETSHYGPAVAAAVKRFQEKYHSRILRPYGYTRGTGSVGPSTRAAVNELNFYSGPWRYDAKKDIVRSAARNQRMSNPWNPRDAFFASALYLQRLGADKDECTAARRYYAGGNWRSSVALNYCRAVVSNAASFQRDIDFLKRGS